MGCSCIKHNLADNIENEFNTTEENNNSPKSNNNKINNEIINNNKEILSPIQIINDKNNKSENSEILLKSKNILEDKEKSEKIKLENNNINIKEEKESEYLSKNLYNKKIFELINKIRQNPPEYSKFVLDNIKYINIENKEEINQETEMKEIKQIFIFKKKVKIKLYKGEENFLETAKLLKNTSPMKPLNFNENIVVPIFDNIENSINYNNIIKDKNINLFFKGNIKNPEIAVLLMIIDDNEFSEKKKRNAILNKEFKHIGIESKFVNNKFIAHFSFSKG